MASNIVAFWGHLSRINLVAPHLHRVTMHQPCWDRHGVPCGGHRRNSLLVYMCVHVPVSAKSSYHHSNSNVCRRTVGWFIRIYTFTESMCLISRGRSVSSWTRGSVVLIIYRNAKTVVLFLDWCCDQSLKLRVFFKWQVGTFKF
jgi:hypothetical protein